MWLERPLAEPQRTVHGPLVYVMRRAILSILSSVRKHVVLFEDCPEELRPRFALMLLSPLIGHRTIWVRCRWCRDQRLVDTVLYHFAERFHFLAIHPRSSS